MALLNAISIKNSLGRVPHGTWVTQLGLIHLKAIPGAAQVELTTSERENGR